MHLYRISGLMVASDIELPGAWPLDEGAPEVVMRHGAVAPSLEHPLVSTRHWDSAEGRFLLRVSGVGRFLLANGDTITFEREAGAPAARAAAYLQGSVMGMLLLQRGCVVLHASAAEVDGRAMLFCGASGEGKSTLAATLSTMGYPTISDDVARITFDATGYPFVSADARQLKLSDEAIDALTLRGRQHRAVLGVSKSYVSPPSQSLGDALPLQGIYLLRSDAILRDSIVPLETTQALQQLKRNAHRPALVRRLGYAARYFEASARIMGHVGMFSLELQSGISGLRRTASMLEAHWAQAASRGVSM
jgi:energy-coupling factor transporter ATP-binding protein EcfA2